MPNDTKPFSLRLDRQSEILLEGFAKSGDRSRGQVVRDALISLAELKAAALVAEYETWKKLLEVVGDEDAAVVIFVEEVDGEPVVHLTYSWPAMPEGEEPPPIKATGEVVGDRVQIYLDYSEAAIPTSVRIGGETVRIPFVQSQIGATLSWPPEPTEAIRLQLGLMARHGWAPGHLADRGREYLELLWSIADEQSDDREQVEA